MPSALCSISHWVQILGTAGREQSLSPDTDGCHLHHLGRDMAQEQPLCPWEAVPGDAGTFSTKSLGVPAATSQEGREMGALPNCRCFGLRAAAG